MTRKTILNNNRTKRTISQGDPVSKIPAQASEADPQAETAIVTAVTDDTIVVPPVTDDTTDDHVDDSDDSEPDDVEEPEPDNDDDQDDDENPATANPPVDWVGMLDDDPDTSLVASLHLHLLSEHYHHGALSLDDDEATAIHERLHVEADHEHWISDTRFRPGRALVVCLQAVETPTDTIL